jgi:hypothetical protein
VEIHKSAVTGRIAIVFGDIGGHTTWFIPEENLNKLIDNLLQANLDYITKYKVRDYDDKL